ncbi:MAG: NAD-dependent epimerase/dehydratase family protein, partial [Acidimicrobiales bacterium]
MRIVVTGGSGFIGTHVVEALVRRGDEPVVVDRKPFRDPGVECVAGDLRDPEVAAAAVRPGTDGIIHLAASTSVLQS